MRFVELPDEVLELIHQKAQVPGEDVQDLWFELNIYEHRVRQKVLTQIILSRLMMSELEWQKVEGQLSSKLCSVFTRVEPCGARTIQFIGMGLILPQYLLRGTERTLAYSLVDEDRTSFVVEEIRNCPLARALGGDMLTLMHSTRTFYKPPRYGSPGIRRYDARVSGRKLLASRGLAQTCADLRDLLKENNFVKAK